jgi:hypothetical protein
MKKTLLIFISIFSSMSLMLTSCLDDALDVVPENSITYTNFFTEPGEVESAVNSMIKNMWVLEPGQRYYGTVIADWNNMATVWQQHRNFHLKSFEYTQNSISWTTCYNTIYDANTILSNMGKAQGLSDDLERFYKGQCYFTLGWTYYYVAQNWGDAPIVTEPKNLEKVYAKSSFNEVLDEAIKHTQKAIELLENWEDLKRNDGTSVTSKQVAGKGTAYTLLAHIYAWKAALNNNDAELYTKAIEAADEVIEGRAGYYRLLDTPEDVCTDVLSAQESDEEIFVMECNIIDDELAKPPYAYGLPTYPVDPRSTPSDAKDTWVKLQVEQVKEMYADNDLRKDSYFYKVDEYSHPDSIKITKGYAFHYKWRKVNLTGTPPYQWLKSIDGDGIVWRLPELILLRGECKARIGDATAVNDLNTVRRRAGLGDYAGEDGSDIRYAISKEFDREFIMEPGRYYWYVRNGYHKMLGGAYETLTDDDIKKGALYLPVAAPAFYNNPLMLQNQYWLEKF